MIPTLIIPFSDITYSGIILLMCPANERRRYNVTSSLIGWANKQNDPCIFIFYWYEESSKSLVHQITHGFNCWLHHFQQAAMTVAAIDN